MKTLVVLFLLSFIFIAGSIGVLDILFTLIGGLFGLIVGIIGALISLIVGLMAGGLGLLLLILFPIIIVFYVIGKILRAVF